MYARIKGGKLIRGDLALRGWSPEEIEDICSEPVELKPITGLISHHQNVYRFDDRNRYILLMQSEIIPLSPLEMLILGVEQ